MRNAAGPHVSAPETCPLASLEEGYRQAAGGHTGLFSSHQDMGQSGRQARPGTLTRSERIGMSRPSDWSAARGRCWQRARSAGVTAAGARHPGLGSKGWRSGGSPPASPAQWAHSLSNPIKYTDPSGHCPAPAVDSGSVICVDLFIETNNIVFWTGMGDGRGADWDSDPTKSRGYLYLYLDERGKLTKWTQHIDNPSCLSTGHCADPVPGFSGGFGVEQDANSGDISVTWNLLNGVAASVRKAQAVAAAHFVLSEGVRDKIGWTLVSGATLAARSLMWTSGMDATIDGTLVLSVDQSGTYAVKSMERDPYPSLSVYQYTNGQLARDVLQRSEWPRTMPNIGLQPWVPRDRYPRGR
jgi:hypothetical protein